MSRKKYVIILMFLLLTMLCAVGTSTWIISKPVSKKPNWSDYSVCVEKVFVSFESKNPEFSHQGYYEPGSQITTDSIGFTASAYGYTTDIGNYTIKYLFKGWQIDGEGDYITDLSIPANAVSGTAICYVADIEERAELVLDVSGLSTVILTFYIDIGDVERQFEIKSGPDNLSGNGTYYLIAGTFVDYTISSSAKDEGLWQAKATWSWSITGSLDDKSANGTGPMVTVSGKWFRMPNSGTVTVKATSENGG